MLSIPLLGPWDPDLSHLLYHIPQFVEEGASDFIFLRNEENCQHVIHWNLVTILVKIVSFYVNFIKVEKPQYVYGPSSTNDGGVTNVSLWDVCCVRQCNLLFFMYVSVLWDICNCLRQTKAMF